MIWINWFIDHLIEIGIILGAMDIIVGALPDKIAKYPGAILAVGHQLYGYGKEVKGETKKKATDS